MYPLFSSKYLNYKDWLKILEFKKIAAASVRSTTGTKYDYDFFSNVVTIKNGMNNKRTLFNWYHLNSFYLLPNRIYPSYRYANIAKMNSCINQRRSFSSCKRAINKLNPNWVTGFCHGEACFRIAIHENSNYKTGWRVEFFFLWLHYTIKI